MYDEIEIREIIFDAQSKLDRLFVGLKVVVVEDETVATEKDVVKALNDRQKAGFSANDNIEYASYYVPDRALHSRPNWLPSSLNSDVVPVFNGAVEPIQPIKGSYFSRLYERVLAIFKSYFNKQEQKQVAALPTSKHRNSVSCRIFKDGASL
jgi:hypothetical protein